MYSMDFRMNCVTFILAFFLFIYSANGTKFNLKSFSYTECNTSSNTLVHVVKDSIYLHPYIDQNSGNLTVGATIHIFRPIYGHSLKLNVTVQKKLLGFYTKIPCVANFGSCIYDVCDIIMNQTKAQCSVHFMNSTLPCQCPLPPGTFTIHPTSISTSSFLSYISSGQYTADVKLVDEAIDEEVACYHLNAELQEDNSGFLFG